MRVWAVLGTLALLTACDDGGGAGDEAPSDAVVAADGAADDAGAAAADAASTMDAAVTDAAVADAAVPDSGVEWICQNEEGPQVPFLRAVGCDEDFETLASPPLDSTLPGARALKSVVDRFDGDALYFQNTHQYGIHHGFVSAHLSGNGLPVVPMLASFNSTEYSAPTRRFLLGSVTHYEGPDVYAYEIAPYDTASAEMIETAFTQIQAQTYFGARLHFHPTSAAIEAVAAGLPEQVPVVSTATLFEGIDYQPLNVAESYGRLHFARAADLEDEYLSFRDIVVLDTVPNDISVVAGLITEAFQTPLSHVNVLSRNRGTPNMGLRDAFQNETLRALEGQWVRLEVGPTEWRIEAVDVSAADAWWEDNKPAAVQVPGVDLASRDLRDAELLVDSTAEDLKAEIKTVTRAYGGKAAHYGALADLEDVPSPKAFSIPVAYYFDFMAAHGFDAQVEALLADETFRSDPAVRDEALDDLQDAMKDAPLDPEFEAAVIAKLEADYPGIRMRFRSSTNAEDLDGFTGAGLYTSKSAEIGDPDRTVADAIRKVWASVWFFRAFEERSYRSIDHTAVGMALLVHRSFPDEEANGVALTNNPFDPAGLEPALYVNVQAGELSVVLPEAGTTTDEFLYFFDRPDQPITYISHSNQVPEGETVLTAAQTFALGQGLTAVRDGFARAYAPEGGGWWAMDVEFKLDGEPGEEPALFIKQARPFQ